MNKEDLEILEAQSNQSKDEEIESQPDIIEKVKKPRTPAQIQAFEKVRALRDSKRNERKEVKEKEQEVKKKSIEEKIVKKGIAIKKKQILREAELDAISEDDEIPVEIVKKIMTKYKKKPVIPPPPKMERVESYQPPTWTFI